MSPVDHPAVVPLDRRERWAATLRRIAAGPLEFCEDFPTIARRYEAWWNGEILDRPLFIASRATDRSRGYGKHLDLLDKPQQWMETTRGDLEAICFTGDALPNIRVDFGPVLLSGLLGGEVEFLSGTTWTHSFIDDDWSNAPKWEIDEDNRLWKMLVALATMLAEDARGRYLVRTPDLGGAADVLLNLRGSAELCMDVLDRPDVVRQATEAVYRPWRKAFRMLYETVLAKGAGIIHWIGLWSNEPYMIPACDFNYLIGPREFNDIFLPEIAQEVATVGRGVFHLDGPGATNHIDALLEVPEIRAIQYVTGAGSPSALPWIDMFRKIQSNGRSLVVQCFTDEVMTLLDVLDPEGLCFIPFGGKGKPSVDDVFEALCKRFS